MMEMTHRFTLELRRLERDSHDRCSLCHDQFRRGETAHAGYAGSGAALYVGDCCATGLAETAVRYYWEPKPFVRPPDESVVWRYMDFAKFVALLSDQALFFARADTLGDRFEGAHGTAANKARWDEHYLKFFESAVRNPPPGHTCDLDDAAVEEEAQRLLGELSQAGQRQLRDTFVSCWHENDVESEALWRLYCGTAPGVAIRTRISHLNAAMGDDPEISIGRVKYINFRETFAGLNEAIFSKRRSLSHECEVRAVIRRHGTAELGIKIAVNLQQLVEIVAISPFAPRFFKEVVAETVLRFGSDLPVVNSELLDEPFF